MLLFSLCDSYADVGDGRNGLVLHDVVDTKLGWLACSKGEGEWCALVLVESGAGALETTLGVGQLEEDGVAMGGIGFGMAALDDKSQLLIGETVAHPKSHGHGVRAIGRGLWQVEAQRVLPVEFHVRHGLVGMEQAI